MIAGSCKSCADGTCIVDEIVKEGRLRRPLSDEVKGRINNEIGDLLPEAAELLKSGMPTINLVDSSVLTMTVMNDMNPLLYASQQVVSYGCPGDTVLGISTKGNAKNVALALATAKALGMHTIALTDGTDGIVLEKCECAIVVPEYETVFVQELYLSIFHTLYSMIEASFFME